MTANDNPGSDCSIHLLQVLLNGLVLCTALFKVVLSAHYDEVGLPMAKCIPMMNGNIKVILIIAEISEMVYQD